MKLKVLYENLYQKIFSVPFFRRLLKIPGLEKLLQYEIVSYLLFGVLTTVVNFVVFWLANLPFGKGYDKVVLFSVGALDVKWIYISNAIAWIAAVVFSFVTNKLLVFESRATDAKTVLREFFPFVGARIVSFLLFEELLFGVLAHLLSRLPLAVWIAKGLTAVFVVVFNYVASKLLIFRKKKEEPEPPC